MPRRTGLASPIPTRKSTGLADLFELVASSERPNLVVLLFGALASSPERPVLLELCASWGFQLETFSPAMRQAVATLDQLERRRGRWTAETVTVPNVRAVCSLAASRAGRATVARHRFRLERIVRKLAEACELEQTRQQIDGFLAEPPAEGAHDLVERWFGKRQGGDP